MKKVVSVNAFEAYLDNELYNSLYSKEAEREASLNGDYAWRSYLDGIREEATQYLPAPMTENIAYEINHFDFIRVSEYAATVYWRDGDGTSRPAFRAKFDNAELSNSDTIVSESSPKSIRDLVSLVEEYLLEAEKEKIETKMEQYKDMGFDGQQMNQIREKLKKECFN